MAEHWICVHTVHNIDHILRPLYAGTRESQASLSN